MNNITRIYLTLSIFSHTVVGVVLAIIIILIIASSLTILLVIIALYNRGVCSLNRQQQVNY